MRTADVGSGTTPTILRLELIRVVEKWRDISLILHHISAQRKLPYTPHDSNNFILRIFRCLFLKAAEKSHSCTCRAEINSFGKGEGRFGTYRRCKSDLVDLGELQRTSPRLPLNFAPFAMVERVCRFH